MLIMISRNRELKRYCCEDISLIENYDIAVASKKKYECHHRREIDENLSRTELIKRGLYYHRPASELLFIECGEHRKLHHTGKILSADNIEKLKNSLYRPVYQMDLSGNTIKKWTCIKYAADSVNGWISNISKCCLGKRSQAYGFKWRYADTYTPPKSISEIKPLF